MIKRPVQIWLFIGVFMVLMQVVIGGITRLTDSGLSITEWAVIQGTLPPMNETEWVAAFEEYKIMAKKQYETLHADMNMSEFKFIYFWEYFHRLWARFMGLVFLIPFLFFLAKKWIPKWLVKRLGIVVLLAALAATFGWIMVASGLNDDKRTWVSAYKLSGHLIIATSLFGYLFWTWLKTIQPQTADFKLDRFRKWGWGILGVLIVQIIFGGLMAGMRAGLVHPYFPFFVEGSRLWNILSVTQEANAEKMLDYESAVFIKGVVQVLHRLTAYILSGLIIWFYFQIRKTQISKKLSIANNLMLGMLIIQFLLGVFTVINSFGKIPLAYGALHQAGALLLMIILLYVNYQFSKPKLS